MSGSNMFVLASNNSGKLREFRTLLEGSGWELITAADCGVSLDVEETGNSYAENAELKAQAFAVATGMAALADDSGIEVDALSGAPGLYSARYGGPGLSDTRRTALLLESLAGVPDGMRSARFRCVLCLRAADGRVWYTEGVCEGVIARAPRGENGFGYDPVFELPRLGRTMAELTEVEKNQLSHRALACGALRPILEGLAKR